MTDTMLGVSWFIFLYFHYQVAWVNLRYGIIPDRLTLIGTVCGLFLSGMVPAMHGESSAISSIAMSVFGAVVGFFALWTLAKAGKLFFGVKITNFPKPTPFSLLVDPPHGRFEMGGLEFEWAEFFYRDSDRLRIVGHIAIEDPPVEGGIGTDATFSVDRLWLANREFDVVNLRYVTGHATQVRIPREVIGFGIVKFFLFVGSFLGPAAVLAYLGLVTAITILAAGWQTISSRISARQPNWRIDVGPYAAVTATIFIAYRAHSLGWL